MLPHLILAVLASHQQLTSHTHTQSFSAQVQTAKTKQAEKKGRRRHPLHSLQSLTDFPIENANSCSSLDTGALLMQVHSSRLRRVYCHSKMLGIMSTQRLVLGPGLRVISAQCRQHAWKCRAVSERVNTHGPQRRYQSQMHWAVQEKTRNCGKEGDREGCRER